MASTTGGYFVFSWKEGSEVKERERYLGSIGCKDQKNTHVTNDNNSMKTKVDLNLNI